MKYRILIFTFTLLSTISVFAQPADMTGSLNSFSFELYKQLKSDTENLFFSPLSIDVALLMVREGAEKGTKSEFDKVLHIDSNMKPNDVHDFILNLKSFKDSTNQLRIANAIWIKRGYKIIPNFQHSIQTNYLSNVFQVNFSDPDMSAGKINKWTARKTNNLINKAISPAQINSSTKLILTNAIYFIDKWDKQFEPYLTHRDDFYGINGDTVKINFMHDTELMNYFENDDFQFISKNYKGNDKSFCVILPKKREGISAVEKIMDKPILDSIFKLVVLTDVELSLPKFKMETSYTLNESLLQLGLKKAFTREADFSGISSPSQLKISEVLHKTYIEINEVNTKAAGVTAIDCTDGLMLPDPQRKIFKADHPFLFMIIDSKTKGIIFMGRFVKQQ